MKKILKNVKWADVTSTLCIVFFAASVVAWAVTMLELSSNYELLSKAVKSTGSWYGDIFYTLNYMWNHSTWFQVMVVSYTLSAVCCSPGAVLLSIGMVPMSILLLLPCPCDVTMISLNSWIFLFGVGVIIGVVAFATFVAFHKEEVSPAK